MSLMNQIISKSRKDTNINLVKLITQVQNINAQCIREWEDMERVQSRNLGGQKHD